VQWWLDELDFLVDFLIPDARLVIEVDGPSHEGREGEDRVRSVYIRHAAYDIARASSDDVMARADHIAAQIAFRVHARLDRDDEAGLQRTHGPSA
jgi:very-short-patch-repair endonuclease